MIDSLALSVVVLAGLYFFSLAVVSLIMPARAEVFLLGFASSAPAHYVELVLRLVVGAAFVLHAPRMQFSGAFAFFGWVLLATTACLVLVPWRLHHRFSRQAVPRATRHIALIGLASLVFGALILTAVVRGSSA